MPHPGNIRQAHSPLFTIHVGTFVSRPTWRLPSPSCALPIASAVPRQCAYEPLGSIRAWEWIAWAKLIS
jgi:hypothetical protein